MKVLTAIIQDLRKPLKSKKKESNLVVSKENQIYPIKLRVTFNRKQKYYQTNLTMSQTEFDTVMGKNPKGDNKKWKLQLEGLEQKAHLIIESMAVFDFDQFTKKLKSDQLVREDVYGYYDQMIANYKQRDSLGTASNYSCSKQSLKKFKPKLVFYEITVDFLERYESWLLKNEKSVSTVGIYLRPLRSVINHAMANEVLSKDFNYPFGSKSKRKYAIPTSKNTKKALETSELKLLFQFVPVAGSWNDKALDFWKFSYLANGMNMKDVANLRYRDIDGDYIQFVRAKTKNTNQTSTQIRIYQTAEIKAIIKKWGSPKIQSNEYIFPILKDGLSAEKQRTDIHQFIKMVNKYMKLNFQTLGINKPCTTYSARHSFSTVMKRSGANVQFISEALGHSSINTTKAYLGSFEDNTKKEMAKALTAF
jgi:integrase/recombinase XerD